MPEELPEIPANDANAPHLDTEWGDTEGALKTPPRSETQAPAEEEEAPEEEPEEEPE